MIGSSRIVFQSEHHCQIHLHIIVIKQKSHQTRCGRTETLNIIFYISAPKRIRIKPVLSSAVFRAEVVTPAESFLSAGNQILYQRNKSRWDTTLPALATAQTTESFRYCVIIKVGIFAECKNGYVGKPVPLILSTRWALNQLPPRNQQEEGITPSCFVVTLSIQII